MFYTAGKREPRSGFGVAQCAWWWGPVRRVLGGPSLVSATARRREYLAGAPTFVGTKGGRSLQHWTTGVRALCQRALAAAVTLNECMQPTRINATNLNSRILSALVK